jgi:hypothetical protein
MLGASLLLFSCAFALNECVGKRFWEEVNPLIPDVFLLL